MSFDFYLCKTLISNQTFENHKIHEFSNNIQNN
eukprot:UN13319